MKYKSPIILIASIILFGFRISFCGPHEEGMAGFEGRIIRSIKIVRKNVFDDTGANQPFYFRWANSLHVITREHVIREELLFEIGQPLDLLKIEESERNLRLRQFIGEAEITGSANGDDGVDLVVTTMDYWTLEAALFLEGGGGKYNIGASLSDVNLLGYGRAFQITGRTTDDDNGYSLYFSDDRIGRSRFAGILYYSNFDLGDSYLLYLGRPQYSLSIPFGFRSSYANNDGISRFYYEGIEVFRYRKISRMFELNTVYSFGRNDRLNLYADFTYKSLENSPDDITSPYNSIIPGDEIFSYPSLGFGFSSVRYDMRRYLDEAGTPEDLTMGGSIKFLIGKSDDLFGADYIGTRPEIKANFLVMPANNLFIGGRDNVYWWHHNGQSELITHISELMFYYKAFDSQVLALRGLSSFAWRQKSTFQTVLGGQNGMRGYSAYEFSGDKAALANLEYRFYLPLEILTIRIGGAAFFDIGNVWGKNEPIDTGDLKSDIGLGLRFGLTRSSTSRVIRLDLARSLSRNEIYISFGTGMVFNLRSIMNHD